MSLLDKASLIVTPNAYKESKLYSVVPSSGAGDMDVVRATTATRVNSAGLIEVVPRNLLTYSEEFDNAAWTKTNVTVTANSTNSPYGALTADTLTKSATGVDGTVIRVVTATATGYVGSIFVKKDTNTSRFPEFFLRSSDAAGENEIYVQLNTSTGATSIRLQFGTASVTTPVLINGYWRISFYVLANSNTCRFGIRPAAGTTLGVFNSNATGSIIAWGTQVEDGTTATEYFPTTTRLNIPRIDYTNGSCPSLLVEPQRSNQALYSEQFDNASWSKIMTTITPNTTISPSGVLNADTFPTASQNLLFQTIPAAVNTAYTISLYVKLGTATNLCLVANNSVAWNTIGGKSFTSADGLNTSTWTKISYSFTTPGVLPLGSFNYHIGGNSETGLTQSTGTVFIWGAQVEAGAYSSSYIPTVASAVTRNADVISKTGISSLIGQTEGTLFCDVNLNSRVSFSYLALSTDLTTSSNYLGIAFLANAIAFESVVGAALQANISYSNSSTGRFKIAAAYKANDFVLYINGTQIGTDTSGTVPACSQLGLNAFSTAQTLNYNSVQLYKTKLSNTELAQLTTL